MTIAAIVAAAMIAGIVAATAPITAIYADESEDESETEQDIKNELRATGSGEAHISQCTDNLIDSPVQPNSLNIPVLSGNECTDDDTTPTAP
jgi:hypothetical protein